MDARADRGFTLIELLVVTAIIGLLIGMVMPSLNKARKLARRAKCQANLKAIGQGMQSYLNENHDRYPAMLAVAYARRYLEPTDTRRSLPSMARALDPYVGSQSRVFECPDDEITNPHEGHTIPQGFKSYYAMGDDSDPADPTRWGSSYEWMATQYQYEDDQGRWVGYVIRRDEWTGPKAIVRVGAPDAPMMYDIEPFHGKPDEQGSQVYLYADLIARIPD